MLNSNNYEYTLMLPYWQKLDDLYRGEKVVKSKGLKYLPASAGMIIDGAGVPGSLGERIYNSYKERAEYINHVKTAVERYVGLCHQSSPTIQLPSEMEYLREHATKDGQSLESLPISPIAIKIHSFFAVIHRFQPPADVHPGLDDRYCRCGHHGTLPVC